MKLNTRGCTRLVFIFNTFVIKIPNFRNKHLHFLKGCSSNWSERNFYKTHININYENNMSHWVAPSYWCSWLGLIQIQAKCTPKQEDLTKKEKEFYYPLCGTDNKKQNFGWFKNKLVCLDYPS